MNEKTIHVISHTHWDREWYLPFQLFRIRLVDLIDNLLEILDRDPDFRHFHLDGQTIVLQDYLAIRPENEQKLRNYIRQGRILIGPWYQLNDEFLVSGESTIRSLLIGHRISRDFGATMKVGYLPDQFGQISQMPQILRGFGIDNAVFGRGIQLTGDRKIEFFWESPDGSKVLASFLAFWYNNAQRFPWETKEAVEMTTRMRDMLAQYSVMRDLLFMNGVDHLEAQENLSDILKRVAPEISPDKIIHSTLPAYFEALKRAIGESDITLETIHGALREDNHCTILAGTLSARMYLKQANERCQTSLEKYAEPFASIASLLGSKYPAGELRYAWKLLMENHPHDSICGCSVDETHEDMIPRFRQVEQVAGEIVSRSLKNIASHIKTECDSLIVFNPHTWTVTDRVESVIDLPIGKPDRLKAEIDPTMDFGGIELRDANDEIIPFAIVDAKTTAKQVLSPIDLPASVMVKRFRIEFIAENVPSFGYKSYKLIKTDRTPEFENELTGEAYCCNQISTNTSEGMLALAINNDSSFCITLSDEANEKCISFGSVNIFEDVGDVGDEYRFCSPQNDLKVTSINAPSQVTLIKNGPVSAVWKVDFNLRLPKSASPDLMSRSDETVDCPVTTYARISKGIPRVDFITEVENNARDHRLRALFVSDVLTDRSFADSQFDVIERPIEMPKDWIDHSTFHPQQRWVDLSDDQTALCLINKGLPEYEVYNDCPRTLALTLLRCVNRLSSGVEAPGLPPTPGAQCLGNHRFEYSLYPHHNNWLEDKVWRQALQHNVPLMPFQVGPNEGNLPSEMSFMQVSAPELLLSAIKESEDNKGEIVVRFYNISNKQIKDAEIKLAGAKSARMLNLNEEPQAELAISSDGAVKLDVGPKKILTIGFKVN